VHPILMSALVRMRQAELLREGERHRLAASLRRCSSSPWPPWRGYLPARWPRPPGMPHRATPHDPSPVPSKEIPMITPPPPVTRTTGRNHRHHGATRPGSIQAAAFTTPDSGRDS
jgi:hypothetical protein